MNLIIETDLGHDPDDLFAICYLAAAGINIRAITIVPGDPDQIAIAKLMTEIMGLDIPIGASKLNRTKLSSGSIHHDLLKKYRRGRDGSLEAKPDGLGSEIITDTLDKYPDSELFVIGPVSSIGKYIKENPEREFKHATMQGGFLSYKYFDPKVKLDKFKGVDSVPTFNLNGDRSAGELFLNAKIAHRFMVGKNICHTVEFNKETLDKYYDDSGSENIDASDLFKEAADMYFEMHESKKFHDPTAACLHLNHEIGAWFPGNVVKMGSGWGTVPGIDSLILADIDYELLWNTLLSFN